MNSGRCIMGTLLTEQSKYYRECSRLSCSTLNWETSKFKKTVEIMITFSPVLWILLFLILTILANVLG